MTAIQNIPSFHYHGCGWAVPQVQCAPSISWDAINANHRSEPTYAGHLPDGSSVQKHSADPLYLLHGAHLRCIQGANGRRLWQAIDRHGHVIAAHPKHNACYLLALSTLTGA